MIPIVNVGYASTNYYVLGSNTTRLLIDVGWPGTLPKLMATLRRAAIPLQNIGYLLVTHYHPDHAGLVQELKAQGVRLIVLEPQLLAIPQLKRSMKPGIAVCGHHAGMTTCCWPSTTAGHSWRVLALWGRSSARRDTPMTVLRWFWTKEVRLLATCYPQALSIAISIRASAGAGMRFDR